MRNLKVVRVDVENNLLLVCGAVPGPNGGYVVIRQTNKL
jgi:large subunit ribosomal protein L3